MPEQNNKLTNDVLADSAKNFAVGSGTVAAVNGVSSLAISAVGFTQAGVAAGSTAAGIQAGIGAVSAGSAFAGLQSLGALGLGILGTAILPVAIGTGVVLGAIPFIKSWWGPKNG